MNLHELTISQARKKLDTKEISSVALTTASLERLEKLEPQLNAFITVTKQKAMDDAKKADSRIAGGETTPLLGIPFSLKDMYLTKGIKTTAASKVLENYIPQYS